jgi:hypothetical protein
MKIKSAGCEEIQMRLEAAHDSGMKAAEDTEKHLEGCADCRAYNAFLSGLAPLIREAVIAGTQRTRSSTFHSRVPKVRQPRRFGLAYGVGIAAAFVIVVGALSIVFVSLDQSRSLAPENAKELVASIIDQPVLLDTPYTSRDSGIVSDGFFSEPILGGNPDETMSELSRYLIE